MTDPWPPPLGLTGNPGLLRISASLAGADEHDCATYAAAKARPAMWPQTRVRAPKGRLEDFTLGPLQSVLDRVEFGGVTLDVALRELERARHPLHDTQKQFIRHAVHRYMHNERPHDAPHVVPCKDEWVASADKDGRRWEYVPWGRAYHDEDRQLREFRFLRYGSAGKRERPAAQIAVAAYAAAFGRPVAQPHNHVEPYVLGDAEPVGWIRVAEVGLHDGTYAVHFEGTPQQARAYFAEHGAPRAAMLVRGGTTVAGAPCVKCKLLTTCETPIKAPGLLGLSSPRRPWPLRKVSPSDLRYYRDCPAMALAYSLRLPRTEEYSPENRLGKAVHRVLEINHGGPVLSACTAYDMPMAEPDWGEEPNRMSGEWARIGSRMLGWHLEFCPMHSNAVTDVRPEPELTFYDTMANALVVVTPDLLYREHGGVVWRETKTTQRDHRYHDDFLDEYPQLALATVLLDQGALGGDLASARVELETLKPDGSNLETIWPFEEPDRVAKARQVLHDLAEPWRSDEVFTARPDPRQCRRCPVSAWCSSRADGEEPS